MLRAEHVDKSMQASPNLRKAWATSQVADHFRRRMFLAYKWKKQDTDGAYPPSAQLEEVMGAQD